MSSHAVVPSIIPIPNPAPAEWTGLLLDRGRMQVTPGQPFGFTGRVHLYDPDTGTVGPQVGVLNCTDAEIVGRYPNGIGQVVVPFLQAVGGLMQRAQLEAMIASAEDGPEKDALVAGLASLESQLRGEATPEVEE